MVPNVLWTWPGLSFKAKGFMAYLLQFRHGVCPPVAAMEQATGLGRDARRAVMAELERAGLARWLVQRDGSGRVVAKFLEVSTVPLLAAVVAQAQDGMAGHGPENPSHGHHAPEKPSDGFSGPEALESRACPPEKPAILKRKEKEKERAQPALRPAPPHRGGLASARPGLSPFQRARVAAGQPVLLDGVVVAAGSPEMEQLRQALRAQDAEKRGMA